MFSWCEPPFFPPRKNVAARIAASATGEEAWHLEKVKTRLDVREARLRSRLADLSEHRGRIRKYREKNRIPVVAVVGYTNSGARIHHVTTLVWISYCKMFYRILCWSTHPSSSLPFRSFTYPNHSFPPNRWSINWSSDHFELNWTEIENGKSYRVSCCW